MKVTVTIFFCVNYLYFISCEKQTPSVSQLLQHHQFPSRIHSTSKAQIRIRYPHILLIDTIDSLSRQSTLEVLFKTYEWFLHSNHLKGARLYPLTNLKAFQDEFKARVVVAFCYRLALNWLWPHGSLIPIFEEFRISILPQIFNRQEQNFHPL